MSGYTSVSRLLVLSWAVAACSPRTLVLVELYSDGGLPPSSIDGNPGDASNAVSPDGSLAPFPIDGKSGDTSNDISPDGRLTPPSIDGNLSDTPSDATPASLASGLVGLWHLDEAAGSALARDSSGNGNHGTLVGLDPAQDWVAGRWSGALSTNGVGYVSVPPSATIVAIATGATVSAWVYFDGVISATDGFGTAISRQVRYTDLQYYHLSLSQGGIPSLFIGLSPKVAPVRPVATKAIPARIWTHLAGTYDGKLAILYVDGVAVDSLSLPGTFNPDPVPPVLLGANGNIAGVSEYFPGRLDEIALWDRALSADEIRQLATAALPF